MVGQGEGKTARSKVHGATVSGSSLVKLVS